MEKMDYLDNPDVPEKVKEQLKAMETLEQEPVETPDLKLTPEVVETPDATDEVVAPVEPAEQENANADEKEVVDDKPEEVKDENPETPEDEDYQQKYLSLKGKYDKEVPRLQKGLADLSVFYKGEMEKLRQQPQTVSQDIVVADNAVISDETKRKLEEAGYDDEEDLKAFQLIANAENQKLRSQLEVAKSNANNSNQQAPDGVLNSGGWADTRTMQNEPSYDFAMSKYGEYGLSAQELLDQSLRRNDADSAARILAGVQECMINDGLWQSALPTAITQSNAEAEIVPKEQAVKATPKPVLPHTKTVAPKTADPLLDPSVLKKAVADFQKGILDYEEYEKISNKFIQQQTKK